MILRAYRICDGHHLQKELEYLRVAFLGVGFPPAVIREVHSAVMKIFYSTEAPSDVIEEEKRPTISLPNSRFVHDHVKPLFHANG